MPQSLKFIEQENQVVEKQTTSPKDSAFVRDLVEKFRVNNLVEEGPVLKKTRKPNNK